MQGLVFQLKRMETMSYTLVMVEDFPVKNLQPAVVKVYDYYQKSMNVRHMDAMGGYKVLFAQFLCIFPQVTRRLVSTALAV